MHFLIWRELVGEGGKYGCVRFVQTLGFVIF